MRGLAAAGLGATLCLLTPLASRAAEPTETYVVQKGDTLYELGRRYFVSDRDYRIVARLNGVRDPRRLQAGAVLKVPTRLLRLRQV
ncbi:MAG TPA: LysM domain-containing protein, partial [Phenylobacterium sp.]